MVSSDRGDPRSPARFQFGVRMMRTTAFLLALALAAPAMAEDRPAWFVYCDGYDDGAYTAFITQDIWPGDSPDLEARRATAERVTRMHLETVDGMRVSGCESVVFAAEELAELSQQKTVELHRRFGHEVRVFRLPELQFSF